MWTWPEFLFISLQEHWADGDGSYAIENSSYETVWFTCLFVNKR